MALDARTAALAMAPTSLLDSLATAVLILDGRGDVDYMNAAAQTMLATGVNQARGRGLAELIRDPLPLEQIVARAIEGTEPIANREVRLVPTARGDVSLTVDCTASPLDSERVLLEISDTTRQQRISRDNALLTQLGGIRGAAQLLERELPAPALREYSGVIIREADRLRTLVDNLLGPGAPPNKAMVNLHELLQHVYHLLRSEALPGIAVLRDYDPSLPSVYVDRDQMVQAMLNIGRNAVQVLGDSGRLTLRTRAMTNVTIGARRHRVVASVQFEDNGPGVPPELADTIFYPLVTGRQGGTGLGLAVAQDLVTRHNGLIEFESRPGCTVFNIMLPFGDAVA